MKINHAYKRVDSNVNEKLFSCMLGYVTCCLLFSRQHDVNVSLANFAGLFREQGVGGRIDLLYTWTSNL